MDDTIVAVATAEGQAGLAVVRLSGHAAVAIARRIVLGDALAEPVVSHRARLAVLRWPLASDPSAGTSPAHASPGEFTVAPGQELDQALVLPLLAPHGYTGEDTVEFSCHGGSLPARLVAAALRAAGARAAGPGEFSRRAFLNGKLSLTEAEAVADLIHADNAAGARAALAQLRGGLEREIAAVADPLRGLLAEIEGAMEFADDEFAGPTPAALAAVLTEACARCERLVSSAPAGRCLRDGVQVVLVGPPNAGKSSLFNALLGEDRALVDAEPGTTRDVVSARVVRGGLLYVLHDTAGLRAGGGRVEMLGMRRTEETVAGADVVIAVSAADDPGTGVVAAPDGSVLLSVVAKADLLGDGGARAGVYPADAVLTASVTGMGIDNLWRRIESAAGSADLHAAAARGALLNDRHEERLRGGLSRLRELAALSGPEAPPAELSASYLRFALLELDEISGRVFTERLLADVFARFCVGK